MKARLLQLMKTKTAKINAVIIGIFILIFISYEFLYHPFFEWYTGVKNGDLIFDSSKEITGERFEKLAKELTYKERLKRAEEQTKDETNEFSRKVKIEMLMNTPSFLAKTNFSHIKYFRDAGILQYEGPETCLKCHEEMTVHKSDGSNETVNTMEDVLESVHFKFQRMAAGFSTYGYNGKKVNETGRPIPVGKIDRACGIPGSFSWTGWAALIASKPDSLNGALFIEVKAAGHVILEVITSQQQKI